MSQIPIYVINLDRAADRLAGMDRRLTELGLLYQRIDAVQGTELSKAEIAAVCPDRYVRHYRRDLTDPEIGCFLSHRAALERIAGDGVARACVLEDDVAFAADFPLWVDAATPLPANADIVKLQGTTAARTKAGVPVLKVGERAIAFIPKVTMGAAAYLVTAKGARQALKALAEITIPVDHALFEYWRTGCTVYEVCPFPVRHVDGNSYIEASRADPELVSPRSTDLIPVVARRWRKTSGSLRKRWFWLTHIGPRAFRPVELPN